MAFQFGFEGDDGHEESNLASQPSNAISDSHSRPVREHALDELLDTLPERISYSTVKVESPTGRIVHLPRRELYDVRVQLLSEGSANDEVVDQIDKSDIREGIYEGGFKTWESSLDLASLLLDRGPRKDIDDLMRCDQIIELGAGTAIPSLILFQHALRNSIPATFVFADYNDAVLRLVTLPNIILTWAEIQKEQDMPATASEGSSKGDLELNEWVLKQFTSELKAKDIKLAFLSGPWSPALAELIPPSSPTLGSVILAAETIYSPASTAAFVDLVITILQRVKMAKAMIGAKRLYFGVGGSVDGLKEACREKGAVAYEVENHGVPGMDSGVGRALIEIQMY